MAARLRAWIDGALFCLNLLGCMRSIVVPYDDLWEVLYGACVVDVCCLEFEEQ